jgi:hypothetical protein
MMSKAGLILLTAGEIAVLGYLTLMTWLLSAWFMDDAEAAAMHDIDWYRTAALRFVLSCVVAAVSSVIVYFANRFVARRLGRNDSALPRVSAFVFASAVITAGLVGSVYFAIEKPYM